MPNSTFSKLLRSLLVGCALLFSTTAAWAQAAPVAPHGYEFMTMITIESPYKKEQRVLIVPALEGKTEVPLVPTEFHVNSPENLEAIKNNMALINNLLQTITAAGWELVSTVAIPVTGGMYRESPTRYLFRKPRP